jgi:hypothetical protein
MAKIAVPMGNYVPNIECFCKKSKEFKDRDTIFFARYTGRDTQTYEFDCHCCMKTFEDIKELTEEALIAAINKKKEAEMATLKKKEKRDKGKGKGKKNTEEDEDINEILNSEIGEETEEMEDNEASKYF